VALDADAAHDMYSLHQFDVVAIAARG